MTANIEDTLRSLRDVQGVQGSFFVAESGELIARDLPAIFDRDLFSELGPRIARLYEVFLTGGDEMDGCVIRYAEQKLYLRRTTVGLIGILLGVTVNMSALRMVANLVIRRLDPEAGRGSIPPASQPPAPSSAGGRAVGAFAPGAIAPPNVGATLAALGMPQADMGDDEVDSVAPASGLGLLTYGGRRAEE
jgi:predicted regulator of Ras-like GTPase activity (Roadblock/LC7/MglB family)